MSYEPNQVMMIEANSTSGIGKGRESHLVKTDFDRVISDNYII